MTADTSGTIADRAVQRPYRHRSCLITIGIAITSRSTSMSTRKKEHHRPFLPLTLILVLLGSVASAGDWTVIKQRDRSYVTFANVGQFYQFPDYSSVNRTVSLRSEHRVIRAQAGTSEFWINGVRFFSNFPL